MNQSTLEKPVARSKIPMRRDTIVLDDDAVAIPEWVVDLNSFRQWTDTEAFPEKHPRVCFLAGEIWIDMSREQAFTHNQIKQEISRALGTLVKQEKMGRFFPDGMMLTNVAADLSCKPDGIFVSNDSLESRRVRLVEGVKDGFVELEGSPDMVLEVVSDSSVRKDYDTLREFYHRAGIREYWLVDPRAELQFDILRFSTKRYTNVRKSKGWLKSQVFGEAFQLTDDTDALGKPEYSLTIKSK